MSKQFFYDFDEFEAKPEVCTQGANISPIYPFNHKKTTAKKEYKACAPCVQNFKRAFSIPENQSLEEWYQANGYYGLLWNDKAGRFEIAD